MPLPPFPVVDCGGADASSAMPPVSPPAFASLPCPMRAGEETPPFGPSNAGAGERRPSATFVFPKRKLEDVPGIYIPKSSAALDDTGKNLLAVKREGRPPRRHSMSADPAHLVRIVAASHAASAQDEVMRAASKEKVKGQRSSPLFPRRPSLLPRSPYSLTDCGDSLAAPPVGLGLRLGGLLRVHDKVQVFLNKCPGISPFFFYFRIFRFPVPPEKAEIIKLSQFATTGICRFQFKAYRVSRRLAQSKLVLLCFPGE